MQSFQGHFGRAYLMRKVINVYEANPEDRNMSTGVHRVRDIHCNQCQKLLGWRYVCLDV